MTIYCEWLAELKSREDLVLADFYDCQHSRVVIAGPGSGKTRLLVMKAAQLLEHEIEPPQGLACLTYSRKLARELRSRLWRLGITDQGNIFIGTLHGFCLSAIAQPFAELFEIRLPRPFRIASTKRSECALQLACKDARVSCSRTSFNSYRRTTYLDNRLGFDLDKSLLNSGLDTVIGHYEKRLYFDPQEPAIDFDMLVRASLKLVMDHGFVRRVLAARYPWILVDEYQDLGVPLHRLVTVLANQTVIKLFVIGDPEQCIYQFQGAKPEYLARLRRELPDAEQTELAENYRSTGIIVRASERILRDRHQELKSSGLGYCCVWQCVDFPHECRVLAALVEELLRCQVKAESITILTRNRKASSPGIHGISVALRGIAHRMFRHPFYTSYTRLMSWLELAATWCATGWQNDAVEFEDVFGDWLEICQCDQEVLTEDATFELRVKLYGTLDRLRSPNMKMYDWLNALESELQMQDLLEQKLCIFRPDDFDHYREVKELVRPGGVLEDLTVDRFGVAIARPGEVRINTIHGSKGGENDIIIIVGLEQLSAQEDRNLLYVAMTRARKGLFLLYSRQSCYCDVLQRQLSGDTCFGFKRVTSDELPEFDKDFLENARSKE